MTKLTVTGNTIQDKTFEILEATKTNWSVRKEQLFAVNPADNSLIDTGSFGVFRNTDNKWLGTVKQRYEPMQNSNLVELLVQATDMLELPVLNGGVLKGGSKVFYQIGLTDEYIGNSGIKRYVTALNTHDGTGSIAFGSTNTVVICQNTFYKAYRDNGMEKVRHTTNSNQRVLTMVNDITAQINNDNKLMETFKRMADIKATEGMVNKLVKKLFTVKDNGESSTRTNNLVEKFLESMETEFKLEGQTVWGIFNGVTRYTNHVVAPMDNDKRNEYLMSGKGATLSNLAFNELLKEVETNTAELVYVNI
jgi:phage/plasmid-like protein (TIGR03299 family)